MSTEARNETDQYMNNLPRESKSENRHHLHGHESISYGRPYFAILLAAFSSLGGYFFGYDQGVTG
ncbi:unnamed protein product, partial [Rotaria magnacalcarata]